MSQNRYTYADAGFNGFMLRSMKSNPAANTLNAGISVGSGKAVNFDLQAVSGQVSDEMRVGRINLNGPKGRMEIQNEGGVDTGWFGDLRP